MSSTYISTNHLNTNIFFLIYGNSLIIYPIPSTHIRQANLNSQKAADSIG